jgi:ribonucleoside-diphosphate reductase alpha chain
MSSSNGSAVTLPRPASSPTPGSRHALSRERESLTHKFEIAGHEGYITVGFYEDGKIGEIFLAGFGKDGSFIQCMMSVWAKAMSNSLQYGQPLYKLITNYMGMRFEPYGATSNPDIPRALSIPDYVARWLALRFLTVEEREEHGIRLDVPAPSL